MSSHRTDADLAFSRHVRRDRPLPVTLAQAIAYGSDVQLAAHIEETERVLERREAAASSASGSWRTRRLLSTLDQEWSRRVTDPEYVITFDPDYSDA